MFTLALSKWCGRFVPVTIAAALGASVLAGPARAGTFSSAGAFQANARADLFVAPLTGPGNLNLPPIMASGNGYSFTLAATSNVMSQDGRGSGALEDLAQTRFTFTGKPVTAFAGTFTIVNLGDASVAGSVHITTDTGLVFDVPTAAAGTFFGFTTTQPFTTLSFDSVPPSQLFELVANVSIGSAVAAPVGSTFCGDAPTVVAGAYAFSTAGGGFDGLAASCTTESSSACTWFRYVPAATGTCTIDTCGCTYDSVLRVFPSCGGTEIACNDDACASTSGLIRASRVQFRTVGGQPVLVRVSGFNGLAGAGTLTIALHPDCAGDFNHSGAANVQDIFDFLTSWFQGCP